MIICQLIDLNNGPKTYIEGVKGATPGHFQACMEHYQASQAWTVGWAVRCFQAALEEQGAIEAPKGRNVRGITVRLSQSVVDAIRAVAEETPLRKQARVVKAALVWTWQQVLEKRRVPTP